jgi:hypothetical protein
MEQELEFSRLLCEVCDELEPVEFAHAVVTHTIAHRHDEEDKVDIKLDAKAKAAVCDVCVDMLRRHPPQQSPMVCSRSFCDSPAIAQSYAQILDGIPDLCDGCDGFAHAMERENNG